MSKKPRGKTQPPALPEVIPLLRLLPGTQVQFWVVGHCPHCEGRHHHPAGRVTADPLERLGEVAAPCGRGRYRMIAPPRPPRKKGKRDRGRGSWGGWDDDLE